MSRKPNPGWFKKGYDARRAAWDNVIYNTGEAFAAPDEALAPHGVGPRGAGNICWVRVRYRWVTPVTLACTEHLA